MSPDTSPMVAPPTYRCPVRRILLVLLVLLLPSQLTIRQIAIRAAGIRTGKVTAIATADAGTLRVTDTFATWHPDALVGLKVQFGNQLSAVTASGKNWFEIDNGNAVVGDIYRLAKHPDSTLARIALKLPKLPVTPAAVVLFLLLLVSAGDLIRWLPAACRRLPPAVWLAGAALLATAALAGRGALPDVLQFAEFAAAAAIFTMLLRDPALRRKSLSTLIVGAWAMIIVAGWEYAAILRHQTPGGLLDIGTLDGLFGISWQPPRPGERGSIASRNVLAGYVALTVPLLVAAGLSASRSRPWRLAALLAAIGLLPLCHQAAFLLLAILAASCVALVMRPRIWLLVPAAAAAAMAVAFATIPHHGKILLDSVALYRYTDTFGLHSQPMRGAGGDDPDLGDWSPWQQKFVERQAARNAIGMHPLRGSGLGTYQSVINSYYSQGPMPALWVPKPAVNLMERDAHPAWLILAVEGGLLLPMLLIAALLAVIIPQLRYGHGHAERTALWLAAALVLVGIGFIGSCMVRGLFDWSALFLALAATTVASTADNGTEPDAK